MVSKSFNVNHSTKLVSVTAHADIGVNEPLTRQSLTNLCRPTLLSRVALIADSRKVDAAANQSTTNNQNFSDL